MDTCSNKTPLPNLACTYLFGTGSRLWNCNLTRPVRDQVVQAGRYLYIFMERAEQGDLLEYIRTNGALSLPIAKQMFQVSDFVFKARVILVFLFY